MHVMIVVLLSFMAVMQRRKARTLCVGVWSRICLPQCPRRTQRIT